MLMAGRNSIRDVIAFPKVQNSSCLMTNAPDEVEPKQLEELKIRWICKIEFIKFDLQSGFVLNFKDKSKGTKKHGCKNVLYPCFLYRFLK